MQGIIRVIQDVVKQGKQRHQAKIRHRVVGVLTHQQVITHQCEQKSDKIGNNKRQGCLTKQLIDHRQHKEGHRAVMVDQSRKLKHFPESRVILKPAQMSARLISEPDINTKDQYRPYHQQGTD